MKSLTIISMFILVFNLSFINAQESKDIIIKNFLKDVITLEDGQLSKDSPINSFNEIAKTKAAKTILLTKDNIKESLADAKNFKYCIVTVGKYTIVKVVDLENCKQSGSWGACMPFGTGYIQKGSLTLKENYINNIIGIPDSQERFMFLFN